MSWSRATNLASLTAVLSLFLSIAIAAPSYNARQIAPRSVFLTLPSTLPAPELRLSVEPLASGKLRLIIDAEHFQFTDLCVPDAAARPVGHAHVIVDGEKIASAYQPIIDLDLDGSGLHEITVILRGQDHRALIGSNGLITARLHLDIPRPPPDQATNIHS